MGKSSPPPAPNPIDSARAQTGTNVSTSVANAFLNNTNQNTPEGSLRYDVTDNFQWTDPSTGSTYTIPRFTATQSLTPQGQAIQDQTMGAKLNMAGLANTQSGRLASHLSSDIDLSKAPEAGDASTIANAPMAQTTFGDVGSQQRTFGDAGAITKSYGAGDFSQDRQRVEDSLMARINPQLARERGNIEQRLADQGIRYGSQAYTSAMDDYNRQATDTRFGAIGAAGSEQARMMDMAAQRAGFENAAQQQEYTQQGGRATFANQAQAADFSQAAARGEFANAGLAQQLQQKQAAFGAQNAQRGQYLSEEYAKRNQPINEINSLMSGSQISQPNFINTPNQQIPTTDIAGLINNRFSQDMDIYKQESANSNALMGGLFGLAGGVMRGGMMSDERMKEKITPMGSVYAMSPEGKRKKLPISEWQYKGDKTRRIGPMAQDVEKVDPGAVAERDDGMKYIDPDMVMGSILRAA